MAELKRSLGYPAIIALGITSMMGTGLFFGTTLAAQKSGNASLIAWLILGAIAIYVSTLFAELASMFPNAGGVYEFAKQAYGRFPSFLIGWLAWIVSNIGITLAIVAAIILVFPASTPAALKITIALAFIFLLNTIAYKGIEGSTKVLIVFASITLILILAVLAPAVFHVQPENYQPFFSTPFILIFASLFFIMESLFGWENISFLSEETNNPEKVIPKSLIWSTVIVAVLVIAIPFVTLGIIPWQQLSAAPFADMAINVYGPIGVKIVSFGIAFSLLGTAAGSIVGSPRLLLALARDKLFIEQLADVHPKHKTPYKAIFFQTVVAVIVLFIGFGVYKTLLSILVPLALLMYIAIIMTVPILRYKQPYRVRPYKAPFGTVGPIIISLIYIAIVELWVLFTPGAQGLLEIGLSFVLFGIPIYLLLLFYHNPSTARGFNNLFAGLNLWMENWLLPKRIRKKILDIFSDVQGKRLLEFGAGVGTLTVQLSEKVGNGIIYATDFTENNVALLQKRIKKRGLNNVYVLHDVHQMNRVHPEIPEVDMVFSVGMLSYIQDVKKVLHDLNGILPDSGKICMVDYVDFFKVLPNPKWLSNNEIIKQAFREAGFSVEVKRVKGWFWNYVFVYGIKTDRNVPFI
ncbi:amino acid permease [Candidatus Woesearchaeota archaeon]|nr:MAG: amino acid permease [Candidatus Woesearchaeota archaeon]